MRVILIAASLLLLTGTAWAGPIKDLKERFQRDPDLQEKWHEYERGNPYEAERIKEMVRKKLHEEEEEESDGGDIAPVEPVGERLERWSEPVLEVLAAIGWVIIGLFGLVLVIGLASGLGAGLVR